jgi:cytochrome c biogenesis protein CcdA
VSRYLLAGLAVVAVGLAASLVHQQLAVAIAAGGLLVTALGLRELRRTRRIWHSYEVVAEPDGVTSVFRTTTPFVPGTLIVFIDGVAHATVVEHPASGGFGLGWAPARGSSLEASWRER